MGTAKVKIPSYLLPSNVTFDPGSGEVYLVQTTTYESNDDFARRLSRNTESSNSKLYKWQRTKSPWRKAVVVNKNPMFDTVSQEQAASIADRLSRPTKAMLLRQNGDTESDCGSPTRLRNVSATSRTSVTSKVSTNSLVKVPRPSARPDKPILVHPSSRKEKPESSQSRIVRFESPLPLLETKSRLNKSGSGWHRTSGSASPTLPEHRHRSPSPVRQNLDRSPSPSRVKCNQSPNPSRENKDNSTAYLQKANNTPSPSLEKSKTTPKVNRDELSISIPHCRAKSNSTPHDHREKKSSSAPASREVSQRPPPVEKKSDSTPQNNREKAHSSAPASREISQRLPPVDKKSNNIPQNNREKAHSSAPASREISQRSPSGEKANSISISRVNRSASPNKHDKSNDGTLDRSKITTPENKNMGLVLDFFSQLPGIKDEIDED